MGMRSNSNLYSLQNPGSTPWIYTGTCRNKEHNVILYMNTIYSFLEIPLPHVYVSKTHYFSWNFNLEPTNFPFLETQARTRGGGSRGSDDPPPPPTPPPHLTTACHLHIVFTSTNLDFYILECKN